ncbi:glycerol-3-phosphate dehydrogenase [Sphaerobacter sp.]|uniref:glycerol-3-phosphate dehydrogenase n=1 Tax=Sphaerobacter sp. TaxID=2099654 RepID=UPI001D5B62E6|nr:glycerol-3-phosphate dehydrogenase [Sphaerobacter sp.]MBX5445788.1 glycerol-3-phosphate dehydrogenase [Sphaerobacter sp.]
MAGAETPRSIPEEVSRRTFDVIVIGAGVNGAGIARDAAMRGLSVLLIEKDDIGSGTTDSSTRLIHGGLRYLEYYEFALVRESLREREILLRIAPHLVRPLGFLIPIYSDMKRGPGLIRLGMIAYDVLSYDKSLPRHQMLDREATLRREPGLDPDGLVGAAFYYDAQVPYPERLTLENALSARDHGAVVLTYAKVDRLLIENDQVVGVHFTDVLNGGEHEARGRLVVNAAGPWVDEVLQGIGAPRMIGGTKGTHIVVDPFPGAPTEALYVEARADGRPYFIVPWNGRYLIGTTDIRYDDDLDRVFPTEQEIDYLISETNRVLPSAGLTRDDVLYAYAGVRPLPYKEEASPGSITRSHIIYDHARHAPELGGLISIIGGKITTYRSLAEETVDLVFQKLNRPVPPCRTGRIPLPGGNTRDWDAFAANFIATAGLDEPVARRLLHIYGTFAPTVRRLAGDDPRLLGPLGPSSLAIGAEIPYAVRWELAQTLTDVFMRRAMVGWDPDVGRDEIEAAGEIARDYLGWDKARVQREVADYRAYTERFRPREPAVAS